MGQMRMWPAAVAAVVVALVAAGPAWSAPPQRVLVLVLDQLRPDYVERFDMRNVKRLMDDGVAFGNAELGHMASETVITHNVLTSGRRPGRMGWSDEVLRDSDNVLGAGADAMWITGSLTREQFEALIAHGGYPKLHDYLHAARPQTKYIVVGQKAYAAHSASGPGGDITVTFSGRSFDCDGDGTNNWRGPTGLNVPDYIAAPACNRHYVDAASSLSYGTATTAPAWMYPLDGNRFVPGFDPAHPGGDVWVADAAMEMMGREPWSGMLLTMGGIDKASHMWGGITDTEPRAPGSEEEMAHLPLAARTADDQVGRVVERLRALGQLEETLIVLTTDHAGQPSRRFHGVDTAGRGDFNWYYGATQNGTYLDPSPSLAPLLATGNVRFSYQDSAIRTWLTDSSRTAKRTAAQAMATLPDVIATYSLRPNGRRYRLETANLAAMSGPERRWWRSRGRRIVNTMAAPYGPDVVGLLRDDTSYGVAGDHGGHQEAVQRIPIVFAGAGIGPRDSSARMRSVDVLPTVLETMGITPGPGLDGRARRLPGAGTGKRAEGGRR